jgi:5-methyltetrahydrofolate--homocysteine methyltransferase
MSKWQALIDSPGAIIADGAMGTMLQQAGLTAADLPVLWNVDHPERVRSVHGMYLAAGAQILLTNTFNGNRFRLARHGLESRVGELNGAGAEILGGEIRTNGALIAGDIGPSGEMLMPLGKLSYEDAVSGFREQAQALIGGGADVIWIETMADLKELQAAVEGTRLAGSAIPIMVTMTFDAGGRTMMGVKPATAARALLGWGVAAFGANCGNGPDEMLPVIREMAAAAPGAVLVAKPNAGLPEFVDGATLYRATPEAMAVAAAQLKAAGARLIGGCCGTTPEHIAAMAKTLKG